MNSKVRKFSGWQCLLTACLVCLMPSFTEAAEIIVNRYYPDDGPSGYKFLHEALGAAGSGDTISIYENASQLGYPGNITINPPVTLKNRNADATIGSGLGSWLYRIVYKSGDTWMIDADFIEWYTAGVALDRQKEVFLMPYWTPPPAEVEYVFLFSAGQQAVINPCVTTGQQDNWDDFPDTQNRDFQYISVPSMAGRIIKNSSTYPYNRNNTLLLLSFRGLDSIWADLAEQIKIVEGYHDWIANRCNFANVKLVYLCGASRGGALAVRLGRRIRLEHSYSSPEGVTPLILISCFDAVADPATGELMCTDHKITNPTDSWKQGYFANLDNYFSPEHLRESLAIYQVMGEGMPQVPIFGQRCFCSGTSYSNAGQENVTNVWGFYNHTWVPHGHTTICEDWRNDTSLKQLEWFYEQAFPDVGK